MSAEVELISTMAEKKSWTRPPIQMEFQVLLPHFFIIPDSSSFFSPALASVIFVHSIAKTGNRGIIHLNLQLLKIFINITLLV